MSGAAETMRSPSSSSTTRSTPCVDGCCGPRLSTIGAEGSGTVSTMGAASGRVSVVEGASTASVPEPEVALAREVPAQRPALVVDGHQDPREVLVPREGDAEHVVRLAL